MKESQQQGEKGEGISVRLLYFGKAKFHSKASTVRQNGKDLAIKKKKRGREGGSSFFFLMGMHQYIGEGNGKDFDQTQILKKKEKS